MIFQNLLEFQDELWNERGGGGEGKEGGREILKMQLKMLWSVLRWFGTSWNIGPITIIVRVNWMFVVCKNFNCQCQLSLVRHHQEEEEEAEEEAEEEEEVAASVPF